MRLLSEIHNRIGEKLHELESSNQKVMFGAVCLCLIFSWAVNINYVSGDTIIDFKSQSEIQPVFGLKKVFLPL